jgi:hypothetical protein
MSRVGVLVVAVIVVGLAVVAVALGNGLLPSQTEAVAKGTFAPWVIVWIMIGITVLCALALAGFLLVRGLSERRG